MPHLSRLLRPAVTVALLTCLGRSLDAQATGSITGTVRNAETNAVIAGATVFIPGLGIGRSTNDGGRYLLPNVPPGSHEVSVRIIGFGQQVDTVTVVAGQAATANFALRTQVLTLSDVVVTGVTEATSRAKLPFTVASVDAAAIPVAPTAAVAALQGRVAGVRIVQGTQPGAGIDDDAIVIRTPTSINRRTAPLIVVDGAILTENSVDISSLDIESMEIVKGAAASSLYGSRAAAGVIQIRTARGSQIEQGRTRFVVRSEYGNNAIMRKIEWAKFHNLRLNAGGTGYVNSAGRDTAKQFAAVTPYGFQDQLFPGPTFDHLDALFDPGQYMTNSVTLGYNSGATSWLALIGQHRTTGVVDENDGYRRYEFRTNLDHQVRNDLNLSLSLFHMRGRQEDLGGDAFFDFIHQAPDVNLRDPDPDGTPYVFQPDPSGIRANPLYQIFTQDHWDRRARTIGSMDLRYNPLDWLGVVANVSYDRSDRNSTDYVPRGVKTPENPSGDIGSSDILNGLTTGLNASAGLTGSRVVGLLTSRASARVVMEREDETVNSVEAEDALVGGIPTQEAYATRITESSEQAIRSRGYYLTLDGDYADRYIVSGLFRRDGSSLFGSDERWHNYYRASVAYRISAEEWWPIPSTINELKVHYSRGTAGGRPNFADRFETFNLDEDGLELATLGNAELKPERTTEQEIGIDAVALERFSLGITYANQRTVDELVQVPLPAVYGFTTQWQNAGTVEGHTIEGTLEARVIDRPNLRWTTTLIADRSRNRITEYNRPCHSDGLPQRCAGTRLGEMWGQRFWAAAGDLPPVHAGSEDAFQINDDGLLVPVGYDLSGTPRSWQDGVAGCTDLAPQNNGATGCWGRTISINGVSYSWGMPQRVLDEFGQPARVLIGDANPNVNWGWSNQVRVGRFDLYALVGGQFGGDVYNATKQRMYQHARNGDLDQVGKPDHLKKPSGYYSNSLYNANTAVSWFVEEGTFLKMREASVRYSLTPQQLPVIARLGSRSIALSLVGRNLFSLTDYSGYDPEIGGVLSRTDDFTFPTYRTFTFSVDIEF